MVTACYIILYSTLQEDIMELFKAIKAYEKGELDNAQIIELFQYLVDTDLAWTLQRHYGRSANQLIQAGLVTRKG
jgi:hypothetical protein